MKYEMEALKNLLKQRLCAARYQHSLNVADTSAELARIFGVDESAAYLAGLLHDSCKDEPEQQQLQRMLDSAIIWDEKALAQPALWHSMSGSVYIRHELNITDEDMINAVRYHTTARAGMSRLEKIVYLADLTSADRSYPDVQTARAIVASSLEKAMLYALQYSIGDLITHKALIVTDTFEAYNEYAIWEEKQCPSIQ